MKRVHKKLSLTLLAGHRGKGTGAVGFASGACEFDEGMEVIRLCNRISEYLKYDYGINVTRDISNEKLPDLVWRLSKSLKGADLCVDVHFNASKSSKACGTECIVADDASREEKLMAEALTLCCQECLGVKNRCVRYASSTPHGKPAVLGLPCRTVVWEVCFCTSETDVAAYRSEFERLAAGTAALLAGYLRRGGEI